MAGISRRNGGGKGKWRIWYKGPQGKRVFATGFADKKASQQLADQLEQQARFESEGLADPALRAMREHAGRSLDQHLEDWSTSITATGSTARHARHMKRTVANVLRLANIDAITAIRFDQVQVAVGELRTTRSPRTCNHAITAVKAFTTWLYDSSRLASVPRGIGKLKPYSTSVDRKLVRRAATSQEIERILEAAESGPDVVATRGPRGEKHDLAWISGPERAALYRLALGTGFRANELRSITPASFQLQGDSPTVTVRAAYAKNGKESVQPISRNDAVFFARFLEGRDPHKPFVVVPERTAKLLRGDLDRAGIPYRTERGTLDFHALRHSYITHLIRSGANPKIAQQLARHSTITLTLDVYTHTEDAETRKAVEDSYGAGREAVIAAVKQTLDAEFDPKK